MILIRRLTPASIDAKVINKLLLQQSPNSKTLPLDKERLCAALKNPLFHAMVANDVEQGKPTVCVGMATIFFQRNIARWIAEIHDVVVDESVRGKGTGRLLTEKLIEIAHTFCVERSASLELSLTSRPSRVPANALYVKLGFKLVAKAEGEHGTNLYKMMIEP